MTVCPDANGGDGALGNRELQAQRMLANDGEDGRAGGAVLAGEGLALADDAVDRRTQRRVVELLAREVALGDALREDGLTIADFLERVLIAAVGDLKLCVGRLEIRACRDAALHERGDALALAARFVERGLRLTNECGLLDLDGVAAAERVESEPRARLLQRRLGLTEPQLEISGCEAGEHLPALHRATRDRRAPRRGGR